MIIRNNTIYFKSESMYYEKEEAGIKPNTVRDFNDPVEEKEMRRFYAIQEEKNIEIRNASNPLQTFKRKIRDITQFRVPGAWCWIISWEHVTEQK